VEATLTLLHAGGKFGGHGYEKFPGDCMVLGLRWLMHFAGWAED